MVAARPRQATPRSTCGPTACLRRRRPASWAVPNGPTRRHRARAARSPAGPLASPACSMSRRAALPAALIPSSHVAPFAPHRRHSPRHASHAPSRACLRLVLACAPMTIATRSFTGPVTLLRLPASTWSRRELLIGCSHVLHGPAGATARHFPRPGSCGHRSQRPAPPPCGCTPRLAAELAQPTPCCPSCAPGMPQARCSA